MGEIIEFANRAYGRSARRVGDCSHQQLAENISRGKSVIANCLLGFMVRIRKGDDGRALIECPDDPFEIEGEAQAEHVRRVINSWSAALARYDEKMGAAKEGD